MPQLVCLPMRFYLDIIHHPYLCQAYLVWWTLNPLSAVQTWWVSCSNSESRWMMEVEELMDNDGSQGQTGVEEALTHNGYSRGGEGAGNPRGEQRGTARSRPLPGASSIFFYYFDSSFHCEPDVAVKAILARQFVLLEDAQLVVSAIYWVSASKMFLKKVSVHTEHCARIASEKEASNYEMIIGKCCSQ